MYKNPSELSIRAADAMSPSVRGGASDAGFSGSSRGLEGSSTSSAYTCKGGGGGGGGGGGSGASSAAQPRKGRGGAVLCAALARRLLLCGCVGGDQLGRGERDRCDCNLLAVGMLSSGRRKWEEPFFFSGAVDGLWVRTGMWVGMGAGG